MEDEWKFINRDVREGAAIDLDDSDWEVMSIPHDWAIIKPFDMNMDMQRTQVIEDGETKALLRTGRTGALNAFGVGWYRKKIIVSEQDRGKKIFVEFDGAMSLAKVYLNGNFIGEWPYGYTSFTFELTDKIKFGSENILSVRLENLPESSRYYTGAGLYRGVRLVILNPVHVAHWGTFVTTPVVSVDKAIVDVRTNVCVRTKQKA